jgi:AcrR family transcriptional regulator
MDRGEVLRHQRARIHGAMVEAVARSGYAAVNVKRVTALAGVSRRSFYEQFSNKDDCFLATFDAITGRWARLVRRACGRSDGSPEERIRASFEVLGEAIRDRRNEARLVFCESRTAGRPGLAHLGEAMGKCERLLATGLRESPATDVLPPAVIRGVVGGAHEIVWRSVASPSARRDAGELVHWFMCFRLPPGNGFAGRLAESAAAQVRNASSSPRRASAAAASDERGRLLESSLRLALVGEYAQLSAPEIAEEAGVPLESFFALYPGRDECYLAAVDTVGDAMRTALCEHAGTGEVAWPERTRRGLRSLLRHLAENPLHAHTIAQGALYASGDAAIRSANVLLELAQTLLEEAEERGPVPGAVEGLAGALWRVIVCQAESSRLALLPFLSDHVGYVALAPYLGAEQTAALLTEATDAGG